MGNSDIRDFAHINEIEQSEISGWGVAVDASNWLYKYMTTTVRFTNESSYTDKNGRKLPNLISVPTGIRKFLENNIRPIFVFDGKPHKLKHDEIKRRKEKRSKAKEKADQADNSIEKSKYDSRSQHLNNDVISTTKKILDLMDIPYLTAPQAAESQGAYMTESDEIDALVSDDYDSVIFGSNKTVRQFTGGDKTVEIMNLKKTLNKNDISREQLVLATILCGTDYNDGVSGIGPKTSIDIVKSNDTISNVTNEVDSEIENINEIYDLYMNPNITEDWPDLKISNPDTEGIRNYLNDLDIDVSEIEKSLTIIDDSSSQTGISSF